DEYKLPRTTAAESRPASDADVDALAWKIFAAKRDDGARVVADALGNGFGTGPVGEALSLASVRLLLHDRGTTGESAGKPKGSVHGASVGVHASDSANAWRHIAAVTSPKTATAHLVTAGYHTAGQSGAMDQKQPVHAAA